MDHWMKQCSPSEARIFLIIIGTRWQLCRDFDCEFALGLPKFKIVCQNLKNSQTGIFGFAEHASIVKMSTPQATDQIQHEN